MSERTEKLPSAPSRPRRRARWVPLVVTRLRRDPVGLLAAAHEADGDVARLRFGRHALVLVRHPDDVQRVLVGRPADYQRVTVTQKRWRSRPALAPEGGLLKPGADPGTHLRTRRTLQPLYSRPRVDGGLRPRFLAVAERHVAGWEEGEIAVHERVRILTLTLALTALFDEGVGMGADELGERIDTALDAFMPATSAGYGLVERARVRRVLAVARAFEDLQRIVDRRLSRARDGEPSGDLFARLRRLARAERLTPAEAVSEGVGHLFTILGPTATTASWALYLLATHPADLARVRAEADDAFARLRRGDDPGELPATTAAVRETLRLHPPFPHLARQVVVGHDIGGCAARPGDHVWICPELLHRDPRWWPEPDRFLPERWLADAFPARHRFAYVPFGGGARKCMGEFIALADVAATVAAVVERWDLELACADVRPEPVTRRPAGLRVRVVRRRARPLGLRRREERRGNGQGQTADQDLLAGPRQRSLVLPEVARRGSGGCAEAAPRTGDARGRRGAETR